MDSFFNRHISDHCCCHYRYLLLKRLSHSYPGTALILSSDAHDIISSLDILQILNSGLMSIRRFQDSCNNFLVTRRYGAIAAPLFIGFITGQSTCFFVAVGIVLHSNYVFPGMISYLIRRKWRSQSSRCAHPWQRLWIKSLGLRAVTSSGYSDIYYQSLRSAIDAD